MSEAFQQYRSLERKLIYTRFQYAGFESDEEEPILDAMEEVWYDLSEEEQKLLYEEGTKSLIRKTNSVLLSSGWIDKNIWTDSDSITPIRTLDKAA